jgi:anaerobic magnesium-protoporphyrin IX monomethyl ester cyclase
MQATIDFYDLPPPSASAPTQRFRVVLVGVEFEENLSLRYLAGALVAAGYSAVRVWPYNSITEAEALAAAIMVDEPDLVGVSMAFQVRAVEDMTLVQLLRQGGFRGHITAGGQFATLHYPEIFADCPGLDSVVRFEAEATIVQLARAVQAGTTSLHAVPGLVWRTPAEAMQVNNSTPEPDDINHLALPLRKTQRAEYLGFKTMHMVGSRGCHATCKYCCVAALATERSQAAKASGGGSALPGTRRRTAANVAAEIALLYFEQGVRIFEFQDDNWIHPKVTTAVAYFTELKAELTRRGVGQIGLSLKTRADSVQPEILTILKEIGLIRMFVGIESGTQGLLTKLGRKSRDNASLQALQTLREFRVPAYFNALLFGPDVRFADIEPELDFLAECADFPFEIVEVVIYGKTGLYLSLGQEGRLRGNYLCYDYDYLEPATQRTHALISELETRHFGVYSPVKMAADLGFNLGILQVFYPGPATVRLAAQVADLTRQINADQVRIIRRAAQHAAQGTAFATARTELIAATVPVDLQFYQQIIDLHHQMEQLVLQLAPAQAVNCYYRTGAVVQSALLAGLFMLLAGTAQAQAPSLREAKQAANHLARDFNRRDWRVVAGYLKAQPQPIFKTELVKRLANNSPREFLKRNQAQIDKHLAELHNERIEQDYQRLRQLLVSHNPKIALASALFFYVDSAGTVQKVTANGPDAANLTPELQQTIIDLLKNQKFHTQESRNQEFTTTVPTFHETVHNRYDKFKNRVWRLRRRIKKRFNNTLMDLHLKRRPRGPLD